MNIGSSLYVGQSSADFSVFEANCEILYQIFKAEDTDARYIGVLGQHLNVFRTFETKNVCLKSTSFFNW